MQHFLRLPYEQWPDPVNRAFKHINPDVYIPTAPTLVIGARYDTMDPAHMEMMAKKVQKGRYLFCPNGSHLALYDQKTYVEGLIKFILDVDRGQFQ